jgi:drug/metabolite transporter (DMT)-like permease
MRTLPLSVHTIILMLSPVVSIFVALLLFQSFPTLQELAGGLLVLAGVFIVTRNR